MLQARNSMTATHPDHAILRAMFEAAVAAAAPALCVPKFLPNRPEGRTIVIGAGKASAAMAQSLEQNWPGKIEGLVVTRYGHAVPCSQIEIVEAAHPVPDDAGTKAAARMLHMMQGFTADDLVIALISGGGSSLLCLPADGITVEEKRAVNTALLKSGAPIQEMNCVRKHLSKIKGGRLAAAAYPARVVSLIISDVPGDDLGSVASGPTVPDPTTFAQARDIIARYNIKVPNSVTTHLQKAEHETPKPGDPLLSRAEAHLIASPQKSLEAAAAVAKNAGFTPVILGDALEGESRDLGIMMSGIAQQVRKFSQPSPPPCAIISGGETTVTIKDGNQSGKGGRNVEFLLSLAIKLNGQEDISALAADTDGIDGASEVAGAIIDETTMHRARNLGMDPQNFLHRHDAHTFFEQTADQIITGPTLTNVNDFRVILIR
jgi:glycerate 2-kinase